MTAIGDHCTKVRAWTNIDSTDELITQWVRMAESKISESLRCKDMITIAHGVVVEGRVDLPVDWLDADFVRVVDGKPLDFVSRNEFYDNPTGSPNWPGNKFTISGNYLIVGPTVSDGDTVELHYYAKVPPLDDDETWLSGLYPQILMYATLIFAYDYDIDDSGRSEKFEGKMQAEITKVNENHKLSKGAGSGVLVRRSQRRGFG